MNDLTLESLARRVEALEKVVATRDPEPSRKDWREVIGLFGGSEFMRQVDEPDQPPTLGALPLSKLFGTFLLEEPRRDP